MTDTPDRKALDDVYGIKGDAEMAEFYDGWARAYDAEVAANGYATPGRVAEMLKEDGLEPGAEILDFGCGTGLSGLALKLEGLGPIDGTDLSEGMLAEARKRGVYRELIKGRPDQPPAAASGRYGAITAIGAIGAGAAPPGLIAPLVAALPAGGRFAISLNDHTLEEGSTQAALDAEVAAGRLALSRSAMGPHLPARGMQALVAIYRRR